jgi:hypothetical protein
MTIVDFAHFASKKLIDADDPIWKRDFITNNYDGDQTEHVCKSVLDLFVVTAYDEETNEFYTI